MVHAFQYDMGGQGALGLPLWFVEGMAEYLTLGNDHAHTAMWLRDLAREEKLPGFGDLNHPRFFPYRFGHAAWAYLASRFGDRVVGSAYLAAARSGDAVRGIEEATGVGIDELSAGWHAAIRERHTAPATETSGRALVAGGGRRGGQLNVAPALSPDGRWLVYLSERSLFSIELYLADASTGRVVRRLTSTDTSPHFESLQFVASAGAWDAESRRFAFTAISRGTARVTVLNVDGGDEREWEIEDADEAWHPNWSPDGRSIAFAGSKGGLSDLFVLDLESGQVRRLTNDAYADLQPAWSPSGQTLAFVTDRFTSNLLELRFGPLQLGLLNVATGGIERLPAPGEGKAINPQWNRDGAMLFAIADPEGVSNVYRLDVAAGRWSRITDAGTGVTGITELSPALSFAPGANRVAFSVFTKGGYDIRVLDDPERVETPRRPSTDARVQPASRLFGERPRSLVDTLTVAALPAAEVQSYPIEPYRPKLSLDYAGASTAVGGGFGQYGAFGAGGIGLQFSDLLGNHMVSVLAQMSGGVRDVGGQVTYLNRESRWNWGGGAMVLPYVTGAFGQSLTRENGQTLLLDQQYLVRQTDAQMRGVAFYPFSRALRFEVQAGGRRLWFDRELRTRVFSYNTGQFLGERVESFDAPTALNLAEAAAALVYDQSVFGPTSPITGQRYRFEVTPTAGSLNFTSLSLDFRRYFSPLRPFTLAVRGLHLGRYGTDAEDPRLSTLFIGYPSLVRGYDVGSFDASDCGIVPETGCDVFDDLLGSRLLVGNAELRFPLLGAFTGEYRYGPLPMEGFLFTDAGVAWTSSLRPDFAGGARPLVSSLGAGVRVNALGYAVLEFALARPQDRPGKGWVFGFNLIPGF
jgi:Tol biopolymer transport system component